MSEIIGCGDSLCVFGSHKSVVNVRQLRNKIKELYEVIRAWDYHKPLSSAGGGQAEGKLPCGHFGRIGSPCCLDCARKMINDAVKESGCQE